MRAVVARGIALALLGLGVGCGAGTRAWSAATPDPATTPSFAAYQQLLDDHLSVVSAKGKPLETRFDYEKLYTTGGFFQRFMRIKRELLAVPPSRMDAATRTAWGINTYNFLVIEAATEHLLVPGRGLLRHKGVRDMRTPGGSFFEREVVEVEGRKYSLDAFERAFVFQGFERKPGATRPAGFDPRPHFAVVCGAIGCPPLQPHVYDPVRLDRQLDDAARGALAHPAHLRFDAKTRRLEVSSIFDWYDVDFGGTEGVMAFLRDYAPSSIRKPLERAKVTSVTSYIRWNWELNQTPRQLPK